MDEKQLSEIKARCEKATPGPWEFTQNKFITEIDAEDGERICSDVYDFDAEFIVHAVEDIPALIAEAERLQGELANFRSDPYREAAYEQIAGERNYLQSEVDRLRGALEVLSRQEIYQQGTAIISSPTPPHTDFAWNYAYHALKEIDSA